MVQVAIVSLLVAAAAAWVVWSLFLRGLLKRRAAKAGDCGSSDCACGD